MAKKDDIKGRVYKGRLKTRKRIAKEMQRIVK
jgi:hypothetical protein